MRVKHLDTAAAQERCSGGLVCAWHGPGTAVDPGQSGEGPEWQGDLSEVLGNKNLIKFSISALYKLVNVREYQPKLLSIMEEQK